MKRGKKLITTLSISLAVAVVAVAAFFFMGNVNTAKAETYIYETNDNLELTYIPYIANEYNFPQLYNQIPNQGDTVLIQLGTADIIDTVEGPILSNISIQFFGFYQHVSTTNGIEKRTYIVGITMNNELQNASLLVYYTIKMNIDHNNNDTITTSTQSQRINFHYIKTATAITNSYALCVLMSIKDLGGLDTYTPNGTTFTDYFNTWNIPFNQYMTWKQIFEQKWAQYCIDNNLSASNLDSFSKFSTTTQYYIQSLAEDIGDILANNYELQQEIVELQNELQAVQNEYDEYQNKFAIYESMDGVQGMFHSIGELLTVQIFGIIPLYAFVVIPLILAILVLAFKLMR